MRWFVDEPVIGLDAAMRAGAPRVQAAKPGNVLMEGRVRRGDADAAFASCAVVAEGTFETAASSTRTSNRRPAGRGASATASNSSRRRRRRTWTATRSR
jgi:hypothetical protein